MEKTDAVVDSFLKQLQELAAQYGSDAVMGVLGALHFNGMFTVLAGLFLLFLMVVSLVLALYMFRKWLVTAQTDRYNFDHKDGYRLSCMFLFVATLVLFIISLTQLWDPTAWMAVYDPKLALAAKILKL